MDSVNKTLYIPLYGKSYVSKKGLFLEDRTAEAIWEAEGFSLKGKAKSKWLAYYMGVRAAVFDSWLEEKLGQMSDAVVIHIGCGLDSRIKRVKLTGQVWYDVDFPEVIEERKLYYKETDGYRMIPSDVREADWLSNIPRGSDAVVVMEGVSMYLSEEEVKRLFSRLGDHFERVFLLMDSYSSFAARMSRRRNPVSDLGVTEVYGTDDPKAYESGGLALVSEHTMIPKEYTEQLRGFEKFVFSRLYAGGLSRKLYRLYEYAKHE